MRMKGWINKNINQNRKRLSVVVSLCYPITEKIFFLVLLIIVSLNMNSCVTTNVTAEKPGVVLWGENCIRCHNTPSPVNFTDAQWSMIGTHMRLRANLTQEEAKKIIEFMQSAN